MVARPKRPAAEGHQPPPREGATVPDRQCHPGPRLDWARRRWPWTPVGWALAVSVLAFIASALIVHMR